MLGFILYLVVVISFTALLTDRTYFGVVALMVLHVMSVCLLQFKRFVAFFAHMDDLFMGHLQYIKVLPI